MSSPIRIVFIACLSLLGGLFPPPAMPQPERPAGLQNPKKAHEALAKAAQAERSGATNQALESYTTALLWDRSLGEAYLGRGRLFIQMRRWREAEPDLSRAAELLPKNPGPLVLRAEARLRLGDPAGAMRDLRTVSEWGDSGPEIYRLRGLTHLALKEWPGAYDQCMRALETSKDPELIGCRARAALENGEYSEALAAANAVLELDPDNAEARLNRGIALGFGGDMSTALREIDDLLRQSPRHTRALRWKGHTLEALRRPIEALAAFEAAIESDPQAVDLRLARASVLVSQGRHKEALEERERALQLDPRDPAVYLARGGSFHQLGRHEEGLADRTRAIELAPDSPEGWRARGEAYYLLGRYEEAKADFARALKLNATSKEIAELAKRTEQRLAESAGPPPEPVDAKTTPPATDTQASAALPAVRSAKAVTPPAPAPNRARSGKTNSVPRQSGGYRALHEKGRQLTRDGKFKEAVAALTEALQLNATDPLIWNARGFVYLRMRNFKDALADFDQAIRLNPNYANALWNRGATRKAMGDEAGSRADKERSKLIQQRSR